MTLEEFKNKWLGKKVDFDGAYGNQCVDFVRQYSKEVLGKNFKPRGNAADLWYANWGEDYKKIENKITTLPIPGDIVIWDGPTEYGHIAVVIKANLVWFDVLEQNAGNGNGNGLGNNAIRKHRYYYKDVIGFIRHTSLIKPIMKTSKKFGSNISKKGYTFPSSIYGVPIVLRRTSDTRLLAKTYIKGYNGAKRTIIYITENLLAKGYNRTIKTIEHEFSHVLQHSTFTKNQIKYIENIFDIVKEECFPSGYSKTNFWEYYAEIIGYGLGYIQRDIEMPINKIWNKETQIIFDDFYKLYKNALQKYLKS